MNTTPSPRRRSTATGTRALVSLGRASALLQTMPHRIVNAAMALGVEPAMRLNEIDYFNEGDLQKVADHLRQSAATTTRSEE